MPSKLVKEEEYIGKASEAIDKDLNAELRCTSCNLTFLITHFISPGQPTQPSRVVPGTLGPFYLLSKLSVDIWKGKRVYIYGIMIQIWEQSILWLIGYFNIKVIVNSMILAFAQTYALVPYCT